ncbi:MAG: type III-B CRISPR module-associated protein Cmr3 [Saprospiraceae bacterium]|nr:type III-B CRISPR module-associated protein Cmr3 [Saprospiraceae bacterium]MCB9323933.1 type III-B CRISPR module-associated protein Cmr3 [Lewinellaceae bacterium]
MNIEIKPLDTLFFRDGKPFSMGEETWADSNFPPHLSVIYGALRTFCATRAGKEIPFIEVEEKMKDLVIKGLTFGIGDEVFLPMPLDFSELKNKEEWQKQNEKNEKYYDVVRLNPIQNTITSSHSKYQIPFLIQGDHDKFYENIDNGLLSDSLLKNYLANETSSVKIKKMTDYTVTEAKVGIGRDGLTRTTEEGKLYRVGMTRFKSFKDSSEKDRQLELFVRIEKQDLELSELKESMVKLGGEGRLVSLDEREIMEVTIQPDEIILKKGYFKLYLATPAIFTNNSWFPDLSKAGINIKAELVGAIIGKTKSIGGFDMAKRKPKNMYQVIPAGSVYLFKTEHSPEEIQALQGISVSDQLPEQGFGISYFGNFTPPKI